MWCTKYFRVVNSRLFIGFLDYIQAEERKRLSEKIQDFTYQNDTYYPTEQNPIPIF